MRRLTFALVVVVAMALACTDTGGPASGSPRARLNFVLQDSTYKPLLAARDSFWAKVGVNRQLQLFYQGTTPADTGPEFLRFEVANDALFRKPDGTAFGPNDSILITQCQEPAVRAEGDRLNQTGTMNGRKYRLVVRSEHNPQLIIESGGRENSSIQDGETVQFVAHHSGMLARCNRILHCLSLSSNCSGLSLDS